MLSVINLLLLPWILKLIVDMVDDTTTLIYYNYKNGKVNNLHIIFPEELLLVDAVLR